MYIVIVGAGGIGKRLTELTLKDGNHNVIVIDKDQEGIRMPLTELLMNFQQLP